MSGNTEPRYVKVNLFKPLADEIQPFIDSKYKSRDNFVEVAVRDLLDKERQKEVAESGAG